MGMGIVILLLIPVPAALATTPTAAFSWSLAERFGPLDPATGLIDYMTDPAEISPSSWQVDIDACASTGGAAAIQSFDLTIAGNTTTSPTCTFSVSVGSLGSHSLVLEVTNANGDTATATDTVTVRDYLIVSVGDSAASGEGVPDVPGPGVFPFPQAQWIDRRCHRSANAGPAQAALRLERADPETSVTFVDLSCSGAQITAGLLQGYKGQEPPPGAPNLPPQIDEVKRLVGSRAIDAMLVTIGANDLGFADIVGWCVLNVAVPCGTNVPGRDSTEIVSDGLGVLPGLYDQLDQKLDQTFSSTQLTPDRTYILEYFDPTRGDDGDFCDPLLAFAIFAVTKAEAEWGFKDVLRPLNAALTSAAGRHGWKVVDGIASAFATHGYCARDHWIVQIPNSFWQQGTHLGSFHANVNGHRAIADRITARLEADLSDLLPPRFLAAPLVGFPPILWVGSPVGDNGWLIGNKACSFSGCAPFKSDLAVTGIFAFDSSRISSTSITIDGVDPQCNTTGSVCDRRQPDPRIVTWDLAFDTDGTRQVAVTATDVRGRTSNFTHTVKVDLRDPSAVATVTPMTPPDGSNGWYRMISSFTVQLTGTDPAGGSGLDRIEYTLNGAAGVHRPGDPAISINGDGDHSLPFQPVDRAGRRGTRGSVRLKIDGTNPVIAGAPERSADSRGWYNQDVWVRFLATDATSGIATVSPDVLLTEGASQTVAGSATDQAGNSAGTTVGPISVDTTDPTLTASGASDGTFTYTGAELLDGVFTNATSLSVDYAAGDALSGLHEVRLGTASSSMRTGTLAVSLPVGASTHDLTAEDVAGNETPVTFSVVSVPPGTFPGGVQPEGSGRWKNAVPRGSMSEADMARLLQAVNVVSRAFGTRYDDVTLANHADYLDPHPAADMDLKVRRELLSSWLNLVSGREPAAQTVELSSVSGWQLVVTNTGGSSTTTALNLVREVERRLAGPITTRQLEIAKDLLQALNEGRLNR